MLRLSVVVLVAFNLLLGGIWLASRTTTPESPASAARPQRANLPVIELMQEAKPPAATAPEQPRCYSVGPFETETAMRQAQLKLVLLADPVRERTTEALMELGYWVALPSFGDFAEAGESVRAMRRKGLEDVSVVADEDGGYWVSAGYFLAQENARARRDQVRELGFEAVTRVQRESQPRYWLDYVQRNEALPAADSLAESIPTNLHRPLPCSAALLGRSAEAQAPG